MLEIQSPIFVLRSSCSCNMQDNAIKASRQFPLRRKMSKQFFVIFSHIASLTNTTKGCIFVHPFVLVKILIVTLLE